MPTLSAASLAYVLSGFGVGVLVGMTGVGGGSLMTPLLVLLFGIHPVTAVETCFFFAAATKPAGTLVHGLRGTVRWGIVGRLACGSVPATGLTLLGLSYFGVHGAALNQLTTLVIAGALFLAAGAQTRRCWNSSRPPAATFSRRRPQRTSGTMSHYPSSQSTGRTMAISAPRSPKRN